MDSPGDHQLSEVSFLHTATESSHHEGVRHSTAHQKDGKHRHQFTYVLLDTTYDTTDDGGCPTTTEHTEAHSENELFSAKSTNNSSRPSRPSLFQAFAKWWPEILACSTSCAALFAMFVTLYMYHNRPSPDWPEWISLNILVAIYAILIKMGVVAMASESLSQLKWSHFARGQARPMDDLVKYDEASRGLLGSAKLIWRLRLSYLLSSAGALVAILAVVADPFTQQVIHYSTCLVPSESERPSIPRTNYYTAGHPVMLEWTWVMEILAASLSSSEQGAIIEGIFNPNVSPDVKCSTGNCTWPAEYTSLGWCSNCEDISHTLEIRRRPYKQNEPSPNTFPDEAIITILPDGTNVTVLNNNVTQQYAMMTSGLSKRSQGEDHYRIGVNFIFGATPWGWNSEAFGEQSPWACNSTYERQNWHCQGYGAAQCELSPCVRTYGTSVENGVLTERTIDSGGAWDTPVVEGSSWGTPVATLDTNCISTEVRCELAKLGYQIEAHKRWISFDMYWWDAWTEAIRPEDNFRYSMISHDCIFSLGIGAILATESYLQAALEGSVEGPCLPGMGYLVDMLSGPIIPNSIFNFGNVTFERVSESMENITVSLANYMRQNGVANWSERILKIFQSERSKISSLS